MEAELFGYEKGAFTGAREKGKMGLFELANHGTILLDEIGDMSLALQAKLLRTIQENEIMRVGGTSPIRLDVRIISATSRNIDEMVAEGLFLDALYYRLNVVELDIPPLRERREDILPLAEFYLQHFC
jgi:transcriptional regulator with PAS, ATPase and Fis domain